MVEVHSEWRDCVCGWQGSVDVARFGAQESWTCPSCQRQHTERGMRA